MLKKIQEVKTLLPTLLKGKKNILGWGIGKKIKNGITSNEDVITVYVSKKENVGPDDIIPSKIYGVKTDVVVFTPPSLMIVDPTPSSCPFCFMTTSNTAYGVDGCDGVVDCNAENCGSMPFSEIAALNGCSCLEQRTTQLSIVGDNNGHTVINGGISAFKGTTCVNCNTSGCCNACTLTIVARDKDDDKIVFLTNQHCLAMGSSPFIAPSQLNVGTGWNPGDVIYMSDLKPAFQTLFNTTQQWTHPSTMDVVIPSEAPKIGRFKKTSFVKVGATLGDASTWTKVDCAVFSPRLPDLYPTEFVVPEPGAHDLGAGPFPWATKEMVQELWLNTPENQLFVYKTGRSTGTFIAPNSAYITSIDNLVPINIAGVGATYWDEIISVKSVPGFGYGTGGDSGSPVFINYEDNLYLLGIHYAGSYNSQNMVPGCTSSYNAIGHIIPIWNIAETLNLEYFDGRIVVESDDPTITVNGKLYTRVGPTTDSVTHVKD